MSGWGLTDSERSRASPDLQYVWLDVLCKCKCEERSEYYIQDNQLCTWTPGKVGSITGGKSVISDIPVIGQLQWRQWRSCRCKEWEILGVGKLDNRDIYERLISQGWIDIIRTKGMWDRDGAGSQH